MYGYKSFQLVTLWDPTREEFCPSTRTAVREGVAMLLGSVIYTIKRYSFYRGLPVKQSDPRQIWFELCCLAGLTVVMSSRLLTN